MTYSIINHTINLCSTMKKLYILGFFLLVITPLFSQQLPIYSQYVQHGFVFNPAMAAWREEDELSFLYRHQWANMPDAPRTGVVSYQTYIPDYSMGLGAYLLHDQAGPISFTGLSFAYNYQLNFENDYVERSRLAMGISAGFFQYRLNGNKLILHDQGDPLVIGNMRSRFTPDINAGLFYNHDDFYAGLSMMQIVPFKLRFQDGGNISTIQRKPHIYLLGGGYIPFGENNKIEPCFWAKYSPISPLNIYLNTKVHFNDAILFGLGYATDKSVMAQIGTTINEQLRLNYAFCFPISSLQSYLGSSHEILISYIFFNKNWD